MINEENLPFVLEAILFSAGKPLSLEQLLEVFAESERPEKEAVQKAIESLQTVYQGRSIALVEVGTGFRFQVNPEYSPWVGKLWEEKATRYSRALLETLALIAYRQPITRGEIEEIRGVTVSPSIIKTLAEEREWIRVVGHKEVPGRPALYATTKAFLDYFGLKSLDQLPSLPEVLALDTEPASPQTQISLETQEITHEQEETHETEKTLLAELTESRELTEDTEYTEEFTEDSDVETETEGELETEFEAEFDSEIETELETDIETEAGRELETEIETEPESEADQTEPQT